MGIKEWLFRNTTQTQWANVSCKELLDAAKDYQVRNLAFWTCVNMIANAIAECEFRTYRGGAEVQEREYYLWNLEPNANQSRKAFMDKLLASLFTKNEALVIETAARGGEKVLVVADEWSVDEKQAIRENRYTNVQAESLSFNRTFKESEVLHFQLNSQNMKPVIDGFSDSYYRLIAAAMSFFEWGKGQHWKVHIDQTTRGADGWLETFQKMIEKQIKPFLTSNGAVLPEFDGYEFTNVGKSESGRTNSGGETVDIRNLVGDVFDTTARALLIPPVLLSGSVENTTDAMNRWLTVCIDPLCRSLQEEIIRKRYGYARWSEGDRLMIDTSTIVHFDVFANADNIAKLIASGYSYNDVLRAQGQPSVDEDWAKAHWFTKNNELASELLKGGEKE